MGDFDVPALVGTESSVKYHPNGSRILILSREAGRVTVTDGQFAWGESPLKCNEGVLRFPQDGWQSSVECKGIRELNCDTDRWSR